MSLERRNNSFRGWLADVGYLYLIVCALVAAGFLAQVLYHAAAPHPSVSVTGQGEASMPGPPGYRL